MFLTLALFLYSLPSLITFFDLHFNTRSHPKKSRVPTMHYSPDWNIIQQFTYSPLATQVLQGDHLNSTPSISTNWWFTGCQSSHSECQTFHTTPLPHFAISEFLKKAFCKLKKQPEKLTWRRSVCIQAQRTTNVANTNFAGN